MRLSPLVRSSFRQFLATKQCTQIPSRSRIQISAKSYATITRKSVPKAARTATPRAPESSTVLKLLKPAPGSVPKKQRVGRGYGSARGRTSGRGKGGQHARGKLPVEGFTGGQTPEWQRTKKRGFNRFSLYEKQNHLTIAQLHYFIYTKRLDPKKPITLKTLRDTGVIRHIKAGGVKLLGHFTNLKELDPPLPPIDITVTKASASAIEAIEKAGGKVTTRYHTYLGLIAMLQPNKFLNRGKPVPRQALPITKRDIDYYTNPEKRGYLVANSPEEQAQKLLEARTNV